jgi:hypothetical protein
MGYSKVRSASIEGIMLIVTAVPTLGFNVASLDLQGALLSSVFDRNISYPGSTCSTDNCTWPTTPTLAVCSSCIDINDKIQVTNVTTAIPISDPISTSMIPAIEYAVSLYHDEGQYTPHRFSIQYPRTQFLPINAISNISVISSLDQGNIPPSEFTSRILITTFVSLGVSPSQSTYARFLNAYGGRSTNTSLEAELDHLLQAFKCSLFFCIQTYNGTTLNGTTHQRLTSTWAEAGEATFLEAAGPNLSGWRRFSNASHDPGIKNISNYVIEGNSLDGLSQAVAPLVTGNATTGNSEVPIFGIGTAYSPATTGVAMSVQAMLNATTSLGDISAQTQRMADGLTAYIRTHLPAEPDPQFLPVVWEQQICVDVRWQWLSFPLSLVGLGVLFLALTMVHTSRLRVRPWKRLRTAFLLASLDERVIEKAKGGLSGRKGLEDRIGEEQVYMRFDDDDEIVFERLGRTAGQSVV